jgi:uncharacterized protein (TIGR02284 family)
MGQYDAERVVRELIGICAEGARGFRGCAARVAQPELQRFLEIRANGCADAAQSLASLLGDASIADNAMAPASSGDAGAGTSTDGASRCHGWPALPPAGVADELFVLQACKQAEDHALTRYELALRAELPETIREVIASQCEGVRRSHAQVRALRDRAQADRASGRQTHWRS